MSTIFGGITKLVTSGNIYAVNLWNSTLVPTQTGDIGINGGYQIKAYHTASGCGGAQPEMFLELNDTISWTWIGCEFYMEGTAACWDFNGGNLLSYNESLGDLIPNFKCLNSWEVPLFQTHSKISACDNQEDNFFRYSNPKSFIMRRRRNINGSRSGIYCNRSCNSTGEGSYTIIRNIYIW